MRFNKGIHNILVERGMASENTAMLFMCFYGAIRQTNMATDSFNIYLSPVGVKSLNRFVINWQAGAKLIRHAHEYDGFVTLNASTIKKRHDVFKGNSGLGGGAIRNPKKSGIDFYSGFRKTSQGGCNSNS